MTAAADTRVSGAGPEAAILTIWGASGSAPAAGPQRCKWGGETVCFEIRAEDADPLDPSLLIDLGSGARQAGKALSRRAEAAGGAAQVVALLSHLHLDHVWGAPFFDPFYKDGARVDIHCGLFDTAEAFETTLKSLISPPWFPIEPLKNGPARFHAFAPGAPFDAAGFRALALPLHHPGGCMGFRISGAGWSVAVIGDHEHGDPQADANAARLAEGVDLMIYDAAYQEPEYPHHEGWGHSTWNKGLELAASAGVGRALMHHHLPERTDEDLDRLEGLITGAAENADLARQGMRWRLSAAGAELLD